MGGSMQLSQSCVACASRYVQAQCILSKVDIPRLIFDAIYHYTIKWAFLFSITDHRGSGALAVQI